MKEYRELRTYLLRTLEDIHNEVKNLEVSELKGILNFLDDQIDELWRLYRNDNISEAQYNKNYEAIREIQNLICKVKNGVATGFEIEEPQVVEAEEVEVQDAKVEAPVLKWALIDEAEGVYGYKLEIEELDGPSLREYKKYCKKQVEIFESLKPSDRHYNEKALIKFYKAESRAITVKLIDKGLL